MKLFGGTRSGTSRAKKTTKTPAKQGNSNTSSKKRLPIILSVIAIVLICLVLAFMYFVRKPTIDLPTDPDEPSISDPDEPHLLDPEQLKNRKEDFFTFFIGGVDQDKSRTDVMMVVAYDVKNSKINVLNIPRDTISDCNRNIKKINSAYGTKAGIEQTKKELGMLLGIPIDRYAIIDFKGFEKVIDAIGGVKYNVPIRMKYDDPTQNLHIDLKPGEQVLNGKQSLHFVRFRKGNSGGGYPEGDVGRIKAQQEFIKAVLKQVSSLSNVLKYNEIATSIFSSTTTDMSASDILWFGMRAVSVPGENIAMTLMPGEDAYLYEPDYGHMQSYFVPSKTGILELVNASFNPFNSAVTKLQLKDMSSYGSSNKTSSNKPSSGTTTKPSTDTPSTPSTPNTPSTPDTPTVDPDTGSGEAEPDTPPPDTDTDIDTDTDADTNTDTDTNPPPTTGN